jgi:hypothetical protein
MLSVNCILPGNVTHSASQLRVTVQQSRLQHIMQSIFKRHGRPDVEQHDKSLTADVRKPYWSSTSVQVHQTKVYVSLGIRFTAMGEKSRTCLLLLPSEFFDNSAISNALVSLTLLPGTKVAMATLSNTTYTAPTKIKWESVLERRRHSLQTTSSEFAFLYCSDTQNVLPRVTLVILSPLTKRLFCPL